MPRPVRWILTSLVVATLFAPSARAQNAAGGPPGMPGAVGVASGVASGGAVTCNDRFVFVLQDGVLYKFAVDSLRLIGSTPVGPKNVNEVGRVRAMAGEAQPGNDPVAIAEVVAVPAGGQMDFEQPVEAALAWLSAHQDEDGRWDADGFMKHDTEGAACDGPGAATHDVGVTGLACIALLAHGNTMRAGPHKDPLKKAILWLRGQQDDNGMIGTNASHDFIYDHAIATVALSESYGLSNFKTLKPTAQRAINYLEAHRNPYSVWRYQPRDNDNDTSVTTWAVFANCSAKQFGLEVNPNALQCASMWYDQVTDQRGRAGYTKMGESSSRMPGDHATRFPVQNGEAMTAAALFARVLLGQTAEEKPVMNASAALLAAKPPTWRDGSVDPYYWMFGTMAMYQMGGPHWAAWQPHLGEIAAAQRHDGNFAGSWDPVGVWDMTGGRVYATAMHTITLSAARRAAKLVK